MAAIVGIISKRDLRIKVCHRNQPNKSKLLSYTICDKTFKGENLLVFMDFANCKCFTIEDSPQVFLLEILINNTLYHLVVTT